MYAAASPGECVVHAPARIYIFERFVKRCLQLNAPPHIYPNAQLLPLPLTYGFARLRGSEKFGALCVDDVRKLQQRGESLIFSHAVYIRFSLSSPGKILSHRLQGTYTESKFDRDSISERRSTNFRGFREKNKRSRRRKHSQTAYTVLRISASVYYSVGQFSYILDIYIAGARIYTRLKIPARHVGEKIQFLNGFAIPSVFIRAALLHITKTCRACSRGDRRGRKKEREGARARGWSRYRAYPCKTTRARVAMKKKKNRVARAISIPCFQFVVGECAGSRLPPLLRTPAAPAIHTCIYISGVVAIYSCAEIAGAIHVYVRIYRAQASRLSGKLRVTSLSRSVGGRPAISLHFGGSSPVRGRTYTHRWECTENFTSFGYWR